MMSIDVFFFNDRPTTEIYPLPLPDALPFYLALRRGRGLRRCRPPRAGRPPALRLQDQRLREDLDRHRSEEHTSELQSRSDLVCRLLLEKKKITTLHITLSRPPPHNLTRCCR